MPAPADPRPAQLPLPGGSPRAAVRLHPLLAGEVRRPTGFLDAPASRLGRARVRAAMLSGGRGGWAWLPIPAFLVEHPTAGPLLVDCGLHPDAAGESRAEMGRFGEVRMAPEQALHTQLLEREVGPFDVRTVVMTHLHADHASGIREFPDAAFLVDRREWEAARGGRAMRGYASHQYDLDLDWRLLDFDGPEAGGYATFGRSLDLFGDGAVRLVSTPGHTPGHLSVLLRLRDREALLVGDAAHDRATLDTRGRRPLFVRDEHRFHRSLQEIRLFERQAPEALVVPGHDPELFATLRDVYD